MEVSALARDDMGEVVDALTALAKDNNFKVCHGALVALGAAARGSRKAFQPFAPMVVSPLVERMGDMKQPVREASRDVLLAAMLALESPSSVLDKAATGWGHKNPRVREGMLHLTAAAVQSFGVQALFQPRQNDRTMRRIIDLLSDPAGQVREASMLCLEELYRHLGDDLRAMLPDSIRTTQLREISTRFDRIAEGSDAGVGGARSVPHAGAGSGRQGARRPVTPGMTRTRALVAEAGAVPSPRNAQGGMRRGGFGDSGGSTLDNGIVAVEPVLVDSEANFRQEISQVAAALAPSEKWDIKMQSLQRLEGLFLGGCSRFPSVIGLLVDMQDAFRELITDKRSALCRQVCHLLIAAAEALQSDIEPLVDPLLPVLLKGTMVTKKVISESTQYCALTLLYRCPAVRSALKLSDLARKEHHGKFREAAFGCIQLILEEWAPGYYESALDAILAAIKKGISDSVPGARTAARNCYHALCRSWELAAESVFAGLPSNVQKGLRQSAPQYKRKWGKSSIVGRGALTQATGPAVPPSPIRKSGMTPKYRKLAKPTRLGNTDRPAPRNLKSAWDEKPVQGSQSGVYALPEDTSAQDAEPVRQPVARKKKAPLSAKRAPPSRDREADAIVTSRAAPGESHARGSAEHREGGVPRAVGPTSKARTGVEPKAARKAPRRPEPVPSDASSFDASAAPMSAEQIMKCLSDASTSHSWQTRVEGFATLQLFVGKGNKRRVADDLGGSMDQLATVFYDSLRHDHYKVALAALEALQLLVPICHRSLEPYMEKLFPILFSRVIHRMEVVRSLASQILAFSGEKFGADTLLPCLTRSLTSQKRVEGMQAVLEYSVRYLGDAKPPTVAGPLRLWVEGIGPLCYDKRSLELRNTAAAALACVYEFVDAPTVLAFIMATAPDRQIALRKVLQAEVPSLDAELALYARQRGLRPPLAWVESARDHEGPERPEYTGTKASSDNNWLETASAVPEAPAYSQKLPSPRRDSYLRKPKSPLRQSDEGQVQDLAGQIQKMDFKEPPMPASEEHRRDIRASDAEASAVEVSVQRALTAVSESTSRSSVLQGLEELRALSQSKSAKAAWARHLPLAVAVFIEAVQTDKLGTREPALLALCDLSTFQPAPMKQHLEVVVPAVLYAFEEPSQLVQIAADSALKAIVDNTPAPVHALEVLAAYLPVEGEASGNIGRAMPLGARKLGGTSVAAVVRSVGRMVSRNRLPSDELMSRSQSVLPGLFEAFKSPNADVRKAVVDAIVDLYLQLGDWLMPYLSPLTTAQLKLVTIYINRITSRRRQEIQAGKENSRPGHAPFPSMSPRAA